MIKRFYYWLLHKNHPAGQRGGHSLGYWQNAIRKTALGLSAPIHGNILEVGCGEGLFLQKIAEKYPGHKITALDTRQKIIREARKRLDAQNLKNVELIQADCLHLPFRDNLFHTVICINMFYNLGSDAALYAALDEIYRVLDTRGRLIFDIRNARNPLLRMKYKLAPYYDATLQNLGLRTYYPEAIIEYLSRKKIQVRETVNLGFPKNKFAPVVVLAAQKN